jgi:hypothetical protein
LTDGLDRNQLETVTPGPVRVCDRSTDRRDAVGLLAVSALVMVVGFAAPHALRPLFVAWMVAAFPVGWLMSHVLIGIVYYGVVTPIGLILRLRGRDSLQLRSKTEAPSFWIVRQGARDAASYFRQF